MASLEVLKGLQKSSYQSQAYRVDSEYATAWSSYRRLRRVVFWFFVASMLEIRFAFFVPGFFFALTFVGYFFLAACLANWKCPRCGEPFFRAAFYRSLFGGYCFHCRLPKWSVSESGTVISHPNFPSGWTITDQCRERPRFSCSQGQWKNR